MGKFFEALRKSIESKDSNLSERLPEKVFRISKKNIGDSRLCTTVTKPPESKAQVLDDKIDPLLIAFSAPQSMAAESFKLLGARMIMCNAKRPHQVIMVASPQAGDGKSVVAANLAVVLARSANKYALLMDCDLRRPSLHNYFGFQEKEGIHEYLQEGTSVDSYLLQTPVERVSLLPAGRPMLNPTELLSSDKMRLLVEELKSRYQDRYIIADSPPVILAADSSYLSDLVDGVLLVVRSGKTHRELVRETVEGIGRDKILGVVFNEEDVTQRYYRNYYKYYGEKACNY